MEDTMFFPVDSVNNGRTGICLRKIAYIVLAVVAVAVVIFLISYNAFAGQPEDVDSADSSLQVVEEVDLGDQGVFPADHILATVHVDGSTYTIDTDGLSDEELSAAYGFTLANQDYTEKLENEFGYDLYVNRLTVETYTEEIEVPYESTRVADDSMKKGREEVTTQGQNGTQVNTYEIRTLNGETTTTLVNSEVTVAPVAEVVTYGTKSNEVSTGFSNHGSTLDLTSETIVSVDPDAQTFTTSSGTVRSYSSSLTCKAYAYCQGGLTATGTTARQGAIAVDPSVIPLGSELFIIASDGSVVYGYATAEDTGGNIKGHTVDLFYNNNSLCRSFGRRNVTIYVLN